MRIPRKIRIFLVFLLIILTAVFIGRFFFVKLNGVPSDFLKARQEASLIAQNIVEISADSSHKINTISSLSAEGKDEKALNLVIQEIEKNRQIREEAIELSSKLETMTKNSASISPVSSARIALEAVSIETTLISKLITYNEYLNQLLENLRAKLVGQNISQKTIQSLVSKINNEAQYINDLNVKFNQLMEEFDKADKSNK
ncbi:MAG: hypothetical protein QMD86_02380 [Patescibacteria group bacterium]|nr:hypothetical protein [Patescibacteria group bacterium]